MNRRLDKLLTIKSIITIGLLIGVLASVFTNLLPADILSQSFLIVIGFYFGTQVKDEK